MDPSVSVTLNEINKINVWILNITWCPLIRKTPTVAVRHRNQPYIESTSAGPRGSLRGTHKAYRAHRGRLRAETAHKRKQAPIGAVYTHYGRLL